MEPRAASPGASTRGGAADGRALLERKKGFQSGGRRKNKPTKVSLAPGTRVETAIPTRGKMALARGVSAPSML